MIARSLVAAGLALLLFDVTATAQLQSSRNLSPQVQIQQTYLQQKLGSQVPQDTAFVDDLGQSVRLGDYFGRVPTLLVLGYFTCPDLCPMTFRRLTEELNAIAPQAGRDFQVIIISFDPTDTPARAAKQKQSCLRAYSWPSRTDGWHFLTGKPDSIAAVASAVGFHYAYDLNEGRYIHPTGVMVLSLAGRLTHCFFGIDASPADLELAIHDAAAGRASAVDQPQQEYCANYNPALTPRGRWITLVLNAGCITWAGILFGYIGYKIAGDVRRRKTASVSAARGVGAKS